MTLPVGRVRGIPLLSACLLVLGLLATLFVTTAAAPPVIAMTASSASGFPGETVTVLLTRQQTDPAVRFWTITAPLHTTIIDAQVNERGGSGSLTCSISASWAQCSPSAGLGWAPANEVLLTLAISPLANAGSYQGTSATADGITAFTVVILAPPVPTVDLPTPGMQSLNRQPRIVGGKQAGNSVTVAMDGRTQCTVPADVLTSWSCEISDHVEYGHHTLTAVQSSPAGSPSPASSPISFTVLEPAHLVLNQAGAESAIPGRTVARRLTVANNGPGTARSVTISVSAREIQITGCRLSGAAFPCSALTDGDLALGDLAAGASASLDLDISISADTPAGATATMKSTVASASEPTSPVNVTAALKAVALPAPEVLTPVPDSVSMVRQPVVGGTGDPLSRVSVSANAEPICIGAPVDASGAWSCPVPAQLPVGKIRITASQQDINGLKSAEALTTFTAGIQPPAITSPFSATQSVELRPRVGGNSGYPGALVAVSHVNGTVCTSIVAANGTWSCTPMTPFNPGTVGIRATQAMNDVTSTSSEEVVFSVLAPPGAVDLVDEAASRLRMDGIAEESHLTLPVTGAVPAGPSAVQLPKPIEAGVEVPESAISHPTPETVSGRDPIPVHIRFDAYSITPGEAAMLRGIIGPSDADTAEALLISGSLNRGLRYRSVSTTSKGQCTVSTRNFSCTVELQPGQHAQLTIRFVADKLNAPASAQQRVTVASSDSSRNNSTTTTVPIDTAGSEAAVLSGQISSFPGTVLPLLALFMLALAATVTERRQPVLGTGSPPNQNDRKSEEKTRGI